MKVKGLLVAAAAAMLCFGAQSASAIEAPNHEGDFSLNAHVGFLPGVGANISGDYVLVNSWWKGHFTIGGFLGFNRDDDEYHYADWKYERIYSNFSIMARATYGLNITDKFEVHAGAATGPCFRSWKYEWHGHDHSWYTDDKDKETVLDWAGIAGCRFFVTDNLALSAELNYSAYMSYLNLGVSFKF